MFKMTKPETIARHAARRTNEVAERRESLNARLIEKFRTEPDRAYAMEMWGAMLIERGVMCGNCGEFYTRAVPCFNHCEQCIPPAYAANIKTVADLKAFQRECGADV